MSLLRLNRGQFFLRSLSQRTCSLQNCPFAPALFRPQTCGFAVSNKIKKATKEIQRDLKIKAKTAKESPEPLSVKHPSVTINHPYDVELALKNKNTDLESLEGPSKVFAVVEHKGKQYKVVEDDLVMLPYMKDYDIAQELIFENVLLVASRDSTAIGRPLVENARVHCSVEEVTETQEVIVLKWRRRKHSKRVKRHQDLVTLVRVNQIEYNAFSSTESA